MTSLLLGREELQFEVDFGQNQSVDFSQRIINNKSNLITFFPLNITNKYLF